MQLLPLYMEWETGRNWVPLCMEWETWVGLLLWNGKFEWYLYHCAWNGKPRGAFAMMLGICPLQTLKIQVNLKPTSLTISIRLDASFLVGMATRCEHASCNSCKYVCGYCFVHSTSKEVSVLVL